MTEASTDASGMAHIGLGAATKKLRSRGNPYANQLNIAEWVGGCPSKKVAMEIMGNHALGEVIIIAHPPGDTYPKDYVWQAENLWINDDRHGEQTQAALSHRP